MCEKNIELPKDFLKEMKQFLIETIYNLIIENKINIEDIKKS